MIVKVESTIDMLSNKVREFQVITAVLGLSGSVAEATHGNTRNTKIEASFVIGPDAYRYLKNIYKDLIDSFNGENKSAFSHELADHEFIYKENEPTIKRLDFIDKIRRGTHGCLASVLTGWEGHAIGVNFITEEVEGQLKTHMIVVNKGERSSPGVGYGADEFLNRTVQSYTFDHPMPESLLSKIYETCKFSDWNFKSETQKEKFNNLFNSEALIAARNTTLADLMKKSLQKVSNCTMANQNFSMHLSLAADTMRKKNINKGLVEAYGNTRSVYKSLRFKERQIALVSLLELRSSVIDENDLTHLILQAIGKVAGKHRKLDFGNVISFIESESEFYGFIKKAIESTDIGVLKDQMKKNEIEIKEIDEYLRVVKANIKDARANPKRSYSELVHNLIDFQLFRDPRYLQQLDKTKLEFFKKKTELKVASSVCQYEINAKNEYDEYLALEQTHSGFRVK